MTQAELQVLGLDEATAKKVVDLHTEALKTTIPKTRFDEVNERMKTAEATVKERDAQLETLKTATGDVEGLKAQIADLQTANKTASEAHAAAHDESLNGFVNRAIDEAVERDNEEEEG